MAFSVPYLSIVVALAAVLPRIGSAEEITPTCRGLGASLVVSTQFHDDWGLVAYHEAIDRFYALFDASIVKKGGVSMPLSQDPWAVAGMHHRVAMECDHDPTQALMNATGAAYFDLRDARRLVTP
jgi:hypothetical protein